MRRKTTLQPDGTAIGVAQAGLNNGYTAQIIDVTFADGTTSSVVTASNSTAGAIASQFSLWEGVSATATNSAAILFGSFTNTSGAMNITVNGLNFQPVGATIAAQLSDLGSKINASSLMGVTAVIEYVTGNLRIIQDQGSDLVFGFSGGLGDSFEVQGTDSLPIPITLSTATQVQATVGGSLYIVMDDGISLSGLGGTSPMFAGYTGQPFIKNQFTPANPETYNHATSTTIYDSLGNAHIMSMYFVKHQTSTSQPNTWQMHVLIDDNNVGDPLIGTEPSRATYNLVFGADGTLNTVLSMAVPCPYLTRRLVQISELN